MILDINDLKGLEAYLKSKDWLDAGDAIANVEKPGEGNMNFTLRVITLSGNTFIIKQSRSFVEKYPTIAAPADRVITEGKFYEFTQQNLELRAFMPKLLGIDEVNNVILIQDLGQANDYTYWYKPQQIASKEELEQIVQYLSLLHNSFIGKAINNAFENRKMRVLNHEHIFQYPFMENNGFDLDTVQPGLQTAAMVYKQDETLKKLILNLGDKYLEEGSTLLHGDYYPGSFLKTDQGVKIIDPEFCFYGHAEFDLAVIMAHLKMSQQSQEIINWTLECYEKTSDFDEKLFCQFMGVEIMRRIIGLAQLPLSLSLEVKIELLQEAKGLIMNNV